MRRSIAVTIITLLCAGCLQHLDTQDLIADQNKEVIALWSSVLGGLLALLARALGHDIGDAWRRRRWKRGLRDRRTTDRRQK